tara:strand:+ start:2153 stop:2311 length:159 start_codon:yes stop_codon:yes gene_type:complete
MTKNLNKIVKKYEQGDFIIVPVYYYLDDNNNVIIDKEQMEKEFENKMLKFKL